MATPTYIWNVRHLDCEPSVGSFTDVVVTVYWDCVGLTSTSAMNPKTRQSGTCTLPAPKAPFTPYTDLTKDQVLAWIWANGVNKDAVEAQIWKDIRPLPWSNNG